MDRWKEHVEISNKCLGSGIKISRFGGTEKISEHPQNDVSSCTHCFQVKLDGFILSHYYTQKYNPRATQQYKFQW